MAEGVSFLIFFWCLAASFKSSASAKNQCYMANNERMFMENGELQTKIEKSFFEKFNTARKTQGILLAWFIFTVVLFGCFVYPKRPLQIIHFQKIDMSMGNNNAARASPKVVQEMLNGKNPAPKMHYKCRSTTYPRTEDVNRFKVPDNKVPWNETFPDYKPVSYTSPSVSAKPVWADIDLEDPANGDKIQPQWNKIDGKVDRRTCHGTYEVVEGLPRNPVGRTGICSRGTLGRWGPNHAADPIVTRWKRKDGKNVTDRNTKNKILQFVAIQRRDTGEWALPGGMVDPGEAVTVTLKREFGEEAMNSLEAPEEQKNQIQSSIDSLFKRGKVVYKGYVDDPRNTDNSWMETVAVNFHDEKGDSVGRFALHAGDDAVGVRWADISGKIKLFASHADFVKTVAEKHNAHW